MRITVIDPWSKEIKYCQSTRRQNPDYAPFVSIEGWYPNDQYYLDDQLNPLLRQAMELTGDKTEIVADGTDVAAVSGLPQGAMVRVNGRRSGAVNANGIFELTSPVEKTFVVEFEHPAYIPEKVTIDAV